MNAFDTRLSLLGSLLCAGAILAIDPWTGALAIAVMIGLYQYLRSRELPAAWADSRPAYNFRKLKDTLREIDRLVVDDWTWQPHILVFGENAERRDLLARFGAAFSGASGITTCVGILEAEGDFLASRDKRTELEEVLRGEIESQGVDAFPLTVAAPDLRVAVSTLLQTWGIGPLRANTVLLDWWEHLPETSAAADPLRYGRQLQSILRLGCHVLILDVTGKEFRRVENTPLPERRIDVWWWEDSSCRLSLLLAYLMTRCPTWEESVIRILAPCRSDENEKVENHLRGVPGRAASEASDQLYRGGCKDGEAHGACERARSGALIYRCRGGSTGIILGTARTRRDAPALGERTLL